MVGPREPVDRVVDLMVAAPTCTMRAARRAAPLVAELFRRGISVGAPDDHRLDAIDVDIDAAAASVDTPEVSVAEPTDSSESTDSSAADRSPERPAPAADTLAIDDYDHLAARQVVDRLGGLSPDELDTVEVYERSNRHRQTILRRIEQLRS